MDIPQFFMNMLLNQYEGADVDRIIDGLSRQRKVTLRVNIKKISTSEVKNKLIENNIEFSTVSWYEDALVIENVKEDDIRKLDIYKEGKIYLQSLSSMVPPIIISPKENENILDMTAAPGGKTTQMYNLSRGMANITACEKNKIRLERLKYNLNMQGATRITVINQDSRNLDEYFSFDKILLDAPCSGSGTIYLCDENIKFTEELIKRSIFTQKQLLRKALKILKVGSEMVYSTCSILRRENEENILELIKSGDVEVVPIDFDIFSDVPRLKTKIPGSICICPNELYEGFFCIKLKKIR